MHSHLEFFKIVNGELENLKINKSPENLYEPIKYVIKSGGKRIRPILTLMSCELFGGDYKNALNAALGIEIFHNFTLLHDDMMDSSETRRGFPTVHIKWDPNIALLSGDAMSVISYKYIASSPVNTNKIIKTFSDTALSICEGQQYDMDFEKVNNIDEKQYLNMINLKTAVLIACSLKVGALTAEADKKDCENIYKFGQNLGLAFQLQDDLLDVYGDIKKTGKNIGDDIISNKKTFLLINALKEAEGTQRKELNRLLSLEKFDNTEKIKAVKAIFDEINVKEYTQKHINGLFNDAYDSFQKLSVPDNNKTKILAFVEILKNRLF